MLKIADNKIANVDELKTSDR